MREISSSVKKNSWHNTTSFTCQRQDDEESMDWQPVIAVDAVQQAVQGYHDRGYADMSTFGKQVRICLMNGCLVVLPLKPNSCLGHPENY